MQPSWKFWIVKSGVVDSCFGTCVRFFFSLFLSSVYIEMDIKGTTFKKGGQKRTRAFVAFFFEFISYSYSVDLIDTTIVPVTNI